MGARRQRWNPFRQRAVTEAPAAPDAIDDPTGDFPAGALEHVASGISSGTPARDGGPAVPVIPDPLETWLEREARLRLERETRSRAARREAEQRGAAAMARMLATACDDGCGMCRYCGAALAIDATGARAHPDVLCPGPGRECDTCGKPWAWDARTGRWNPTCAPSEHESRARAASWQLATARHNPLNPPPRVYKDNDE